MPVNYKYLWEKTKKFEIKHHKKIIVNEISIRYIIID